MSSALLRWRCARVTGVRLGDLPPCRFPALLLSFVPARVERECCLRRRTGADPCRQRGRMMRGWLILTAAAGIVVTAAACSSSPPGAHATRPPGAVARAAASASAAPPAIKVAATTNWWTAKDRPVSFLRSRGAAAPGRPGRAPWGIVPGCSSSPRPASP